MSVRRRAIEARGGADGGGGGAGGALDRGWDRPLAGRELLEAREQLERLLLRDETTLAWRPGVTTIDPARECSVSRKQEAASLLAGMASSSGEQ
jgi:hypothetical protein